MSAVAVESSRPVSLYEAHFKAIGKPLPRPLVEPSKTARKKPPRKGFRLAKRRAKGGFARDKEVIAKFKKEGKKVKGVAKELPSELETVSLEPRKTKKEKETEQALQIVRDDPRRPVDETTSRLREEQINRRIDDLDKGFDDKLGSVFEELRSEIRFGSEPADVGAGKRRRRKKKKARSPPVDISKITTAEQFFAEKAIHKYRTEEQLLQDYPENIAILKALRDERILDRGLYNEIEAGIRQYNQDETVAEDEALEQNAIQQARIAREKQKRGGRYTGAGSGGFSTLDSGASSVDSSLAERLRRASEERAEKDREAQDEFETEETLRRFKKGQQVFSGVGGTTFYQDRQEQKEAGILAHSSESELSSGDSVRRGRGLRTITDDEDELSSGNLRSDGTSTSERESVASELDRLGQDEFAQAGQSRVEGHFQKFETRKPITRAPQPEPEPKTQPTKEQTKGLVSLKDITKQLSALDREQRFIDQSLSDIRRARGRSGERAGRREEQLTEEAPLIARLTEITAETRKLEEARLKAVDKQRPTTKKERRGNTRNDALLQLRLGSEGGGTLTTAEAIRFGSEAGTAPTGGTTYGVKPRSNQQAKTLLTELAEDSRTRVVESEEHEQFFQHLDTYDQSTRTDEPKIDLSPITPRTPQEETTPRGRGETPSPEQEGGGVLGGVARAVGGGALAVAQGVGGAVAEQLPAPQEVARGIARAGTGAVLGAVQGVAEGVSGALGGGAEEQTDV